MHLLCMICIYY